MNNWNRIFKPIVVLGVICVVVTGALAATNSVTGPIITAAIEAAETAARTELLPEADSFTEVKDIAVENVSGIYTADNGAGAVITASGKGYGGDVVVMVAFGPDDAIKQIKVTEQAETKGYRQQRGLQRGVLGELRRCVRGEGAGPESGRERL